MPINFPPGSPNNLSVVPYAQLVFTPTPTVQASCRFYNPGPGTAYLGGVGVTPGNGLPVLPGNRPVELQNVNVALYACSGISSVIAATGTLSAAQPAGTTVFTVSSLSVPTNSWLRIGNGTGIEYVQIGTGGTAGSSLTATTSTLYDHASGVTVATVSAVPTPLSVQAGVV